MAKLTVHKAFSLDMRVLDYSGMFYGVSYDMTASTYRITYSNGSVEEFRGKGFGFDASGEPTRGTVTSYAFYAGSTRAMSIDGIKIAAKDIVQAAKTYDNSDDKNLVKKMLSGNDNVQGGGLNDVLFGHKGNDKMTGGVGADKLYGGSGADAFLFKSVKDSTVATSGRDKIYDFSHKEKDKIDVHLIDANTKAGGNQKFKFIGDDDFHKKAGELRYEKKGGDTLIHGDVNGDGRADFSIALEQYVNLKASDFIL